VRRCLLQLCGVFVDGAPAWAGADDNDWFAYASPPYPVLAQADGRAGAGRARRPVAVGPVHGLEELGCGRVHRLARDGLAARLVPGRLVVCGAGWRGDGELLGGSGRQVPVQAGPGDPGLGGDLGDGVAGVAQVRGVGEVGRVDQDGPADPRPFAVATEWACAARSRV